MASFLHLQSPTEKSLYNYKRCLSNMHFFLPTFLVLTIAASTTSSPVGGGLGGFAGFPVGVPGTSFFSNANANSAAKANNVQAADNHFNNHVDSNAGNQGLQEDVVFVKNNANTVANDNGFQNAVSKNDAFNHNNANQAANGAVFFGLRRQLGADTECVGCGGVGIGGIPPSGFDNAKQAVNAANGANYFNQANQGRDTNAHQGFNNKRVEKHNLDQESFGDVNANSDAAANALSKGNLINKNEANAARGVAQNNGLFYRHLRGF